MAIANEDEVEDKQEYEQIDLQKIKPNETGEIMVVMYHNLSDKNTEFARTPESFRQDLERLYNMGFRTISLNDYIENNITTEAGYTPVVLTFDDGHITNFKISEENGKKVIDPNCTVGILEEFYKEHPDFGLEATFFLNGGVPFAQADTLEYKLNYIIDKGMDIGNHSTGHDHLGELNKEQIEKTLGGNIQFLESMINSDYTINTLALPFGEKPSDEYLCQLVTTSKYNGKLYFHDAVLKVGWKPEVASVHKNFDFENINRVQSGDAKFQLSFYLDEYEQGFRDRFISDGNPDIVTVPKNKRDTLDMNKLSGDEVRVYEIENTEK